MSLAQLRSLDLSARAVQDRVAAGRLHRLHTGVYAVGHTLVSIEGRWMAAVLACGPGAVLSHRSAGALSELIAARAGPVDVIAPGRAGRSRERIAAHRPGGLRPTDVTRVRGIPCTTVARTLLDLAEVLPRQAVVRAFDHAEVLRVLDARALNELLGRSTGRRGAPVLSAILADHRRDPKLTRTELEARFLAICAASGLPTPEVNAWIPLDGCGIEADFLWRPQRLIVETDGHATHGTRRAFERDRRRDQRLLIAGWRVARCTWRQVTDEPKEVAATIVALLADSLAPG